MNLNAKANYKVDKPRHIKRRFEYKIKYLDVDLYPDMGKFRQTPADDPQKASELIYKKYNEYFNNNNLEIDLRNEEEW